jgi:ribosomal protein L11 methyltransferase
VYYRLSEDLVLKTRWSPKLVKPGEKALIIGSGEAFPPSHPTTRLCLDLLRETLAPKPADSLVDVGCGTGILGLAAAALGVSRVVAVDLQSAAVRVTQENARENGLAGTLQVVQGSTECLRGPFDLVVANLPWEVQMGKVSELLRLAGSRGRLILSGFRDHQEAALLKEYLKSGRSLLARRVKDFYHPELPVDMSFNWVAWLLA